VLEHPLFSELQRQIPLTNDEVDSIDRVPVHRSAVSRGQDLVREGDPSSSCIVVISGLLAMSKVNELGKRQISSFHLKRDMPDLMNLHLDMRDNDLRAVAPSEVAYLDRSAMLALCRSQPRIAAVLWRKTLVDAAVLAEWLTNVGSRPALHRLAHLLCEMLTRNDAAGLADGASCAFPVTQLDLSEATGLSTVHVNRSLQELRRADLISLEKGVLTIYDWPRLAKLAGFNSAYLHLKQQRLRTSTKGSRAALS